MGSRNTRAIKEQVVARIRANAEPMLTLAREYGVSTNTLRAWVRESELRRRVQEDARRVADALTEENDTSVSQRERLLMHALEYSPATIIVTDIEGRIVYANPKFVETTGYTVGEVVGKTPRLFKSGETSSADYRSLWKTILSGNEWRGTFHNRRKDGRLYWERASISPVFDADGKITHFMAVKEDITDYMEAELAKRRTAASFHAVFAALPAAILLVDHQHRILLANDAAQTTFGIPLPTGAVLDALNLRWIDAQGATLVAAERPCARALADTGATAGQRMRLGVVPPTGGVRWLDATLRSVRLPDTQEYAALLVFDQVTD